MKDIDMEGIVKARAGSASGQAIDAKKEVSIPDSRVGALEFKLNLNPRPKEAVEKVEIVQRCRASLREGNNNPRSRTAGYSVLKASKNPRSRAAGYAGDLSKSARSYYPAAEQRGIGLEASIYTGSVGRCEMVSCLHLLGSVPCMTLSTGSQRAGYAGDFSQSNRPTNPGPRAEVWSAKSWKCTGSVDERVLNKSVLNDASGQAHDAKKENSFQRFIAKLCCAYTYQYHEVNRCNLTLFGGKV